MRDAATRPAAQAVIFPAERTRHDTARARLRPAIDAALAAALVRQRHDGHWVYELEADVTIPAEYVLMVHYLGETPDAGLERRIARYLRRRQGAHGGWPLFHGGAFDPSASVKAYFALKMIGDPPDAPHMARARAAIRAHGGAERSNVFTRMLLALFGEMPWTAVPEMPVEMALLPRWSPFHLSKVSYWTRTVLTPLLVLGALRPRARNPRAVGVAELFLAPPAHLGLAPRAPHQDRVWFALFRTLEAQMRLLSPRLPARLLRRRAVDEATYLYEPGRYVPVARVDGRTDAATSDRSSGETAWIAELSTWGATVREHWKARDDTTARDADRLPRDRYIAS